MGKVRKGHSDSLDGFWQFLKKYRMWAIMPPVPTQVHDFLTMFSDDFWGNRS